MKPFVIILLVRVVVTSSLLEVTTERGTLALEDHEKRGANAHVRGTFRSHGGSGVQFISTPDYLRVVTTDGETLVEASSLSASIQMDGGEGRAAYFQLLDKAYAEIDGQTYSLPESSAATVQSAWDQIPPAQLLARLQAEPIHSDHVQAAVKESVERLVAHPAIRLLEPAAQALGEDLGVTGMEHPASLPFHLTAMKLTEARMKGREVGAASYSDTWQFYVPGQAKTQAYPNCNMRTCPPCREDDCTGLCGRRCNCWRWVCNDCCLHRGCLLHDLCCNRYGFYSFPCLFPIGISCSNYWC